MSISEAEKYFTSDQLRKCYVKSEEDACWWWLRSTGNSQLYTAFVYTDGSVYYSGYGVSKNCGCVRPAMWINIENNTNETKFNSERALQINGYRNAILLSKANVGDIITFGNYPQGKYGKAKPIEWQVLDKDGDKQLVICKYALDCKKYNKFYSNVTWESCSLRKWLNSTFLNAAFSPEEQAKIQNTTVSADKNPKYNTNPGNSTTDKAFLLSIPEVKKYFLSNKDRKCVPTEHAIKQSGFTSSSNTKSGKATCWWWLRSPGNSQNYAASVYSDGSVDFTGSDVDLDYVCVRPAMWISV